MRPQLPSLPLVAFLCSVACSSVTPGNPYDPNTPPEQQAPGSLTGFVVLEDPTATAEILTAEVAAVRITLETIEGVVVQGDDGAPLTASLEVSGNKGEFTFPRLQPARYRVVVANVGARYTVPPIPAIAVVSGETSELGALTFVGRGEGSIKGEVALLGGQGGARTVRLFRVGDDGLALVQATTTGTDGSFSLVGLGVGTYAVTAEHDGFTPDYRVDVEVGEQDGASMAHELKAESALRLYPVSAVVRPSTGVEVQEVEGVRYTNAAQIPVDLLAFGGVTQMRVSTEVSFQVEGADQAFVPYSASTRVSLPSREGEVTLYAQFRVSTESGFEFVSPTFTTSVVRDVTAPEILSGGPTGLVAASDGVLYVRSQGAALPVSLDATDVHSALRGVWIGQPADNAVPAPASLPFDLVVSNGGLVRLADTIGISSGRGEKQVFAFVKDRAGNVSAPFSFAVVVDDQAPAIASAVLDDGATYATSSVVSLSLSLGSGSDATEMALADSAGFANPQWEPVSDEHAVVLMPGDGERSVWVKVRDAAGNESAAVEAAITVDTTAPTVPSIVLASGASVTKSAVVPVTLSANGSTRVRLSTDGTFDASTPAESYATTFPTTVTLPAGEGRKSVYAQFADAAGNATQAVVATITLDTTPPAFGTRGVSIDAGNGFARSVSVSATVDATGASEMAIATDGTVDTESFFPYATTATVLLPSGDCAANATGCKSVCVKLRDAAGNTSDASCDTITLDTTAPSVPILATVDSVVPSTAFTFNLAAAPTEAFFGRYEVFIQGKDTDFVAQANAQNSLQFRVTLATPPTTGAIAARKSTNLIRIRVVDQAGNVSAESALQVIVDNTPPETPELAGTPAVVNADTVQVNFTNTNRADLDATFSHYEVRAPPLVPVFTTTASIDSLLFTLVPDASTTIEVRAVDQAGNMSGVATATVREDSTEPSAPEISPVSATVRASAVEVFVTTPSRDNGVAVTTYEVKGGAGSNFRAVTGSGPFLVGLRANRLNEVCVRGRDDAGNVSLEECASILEASAVQAVANGIDVSAHDFFGDYAVFSSRAGIYLHDLRGAPPESLDDTVLLTSFTGDLDRDGHPEAGYQYDYGREPRITGEPRLLRVAISGNFTTTLVVVATDPSLDLDAATAGTQGRQERQFFGENADVDGGRLVFFLRPDTAQSLGQVRWRSVDPLPALLPNPADTGSPLSTSSIRLCPGTGPRLSGDTVIWCEWSDDGDGVVESGEGQLKRRVITDASNRIEVLSTRVAVQRFPSLDGGSAAFQQPLISERLIAWAEEPVASGGSVRIALTTAVATLPFPSASVTYAGPFVDASCGTVSPALLADASAGRVAFTFVRGDGLTNDVGLYDAATSEFRCLTNDLPPQDRPRVDGMRVIWRDNAAGETLNLADLTRLRWVDASTELAFEPVTSSQATAWFGTRPDPANPSVKRLALVARRTPLDRVGSDGQSSNPVIELSTTALFGGPSEADPPYAAGGTRVAWLEGTLAQVAAGNALPMQVRDLATGANVTIPAVRRAMALDPDGASIAYVDGAGALRVAATSTGQPGSALDNAGASPATFPTVDIDGPLVVYQRGGNIDDRKSTGAVYLSRNGAPGTSLGLTFARGPKVALVGSEYWLAYLKDEDGAGPSNELVPHACRLNSTFTACLDDVRVGQQPANVRDVAISRDGLVAWATDEGGIEEVLLWDVRAKRRFYATPLTPAAGDRTAPDIAEGRLVWYDSSLGNQDVWELVLPR